MVKGSLQEALGESPIVSPSVATLAAADRMRTNARRIRSGSPKPTRPAIWSIASAAL